MSLHESLSIKSDNFLLARINLLSKSKIHFMMRHSFRDAQLKTEIQLLLPSNMFCRAHHVCFSIFEFKYINDLTSTYNVWVNSDREQTKRKINIQRWMKRSPNKKVYMIFSPPVLFNQNASKKKSLLRSNVALSFSCTLANTSISIALNANEWRMWKKK